jgi:hypothetical protein
MDLIIIGMDKRQLSSSLLNFTYFEVWPNRIYQLHFSNRSIELGGMILVSK